MNKDLIVSVTMLAAGCLFAKDGRKVSDDLKDVDPASAVNVIVQFVHHPEKPHIKKVTGKGVF